MTISVTPNSDGTITVTCGNDSITIGAAAAPKQNASADIPILWPNHGATASIVADGKAKTMVIRVSPENDLMKAIREQHELHSREPEPIIFQFHVEGSEPLSVEKINEALSEIGNPDWMVTQIKLIGLRDE
jgi:hypothetical protein